MKSILINKHGGIDVLEFTDIEEPECSPEKVKIKIEACAINHLDIWVRNGLPGINIPLPLILGSDAAGIIVEVGKNIRGYLVGDKIVIQPGTFNNIYDDIREGKENYSKTYGILGETENGVQSEYVVLDPINIFPKPAHLSFEESASMQLVFMTSYQMLIKRAKLKKNENILIYGGTSGIGSAAIQIAKDVGCNIISTVGKESKKNYVYNMGANYVFNHNDTNLKNEVKNIFPYGVDVVFEHVGSLTWEQSMKVLAIGGRIVTCGATTGGNVSIDLRHLFMKQQTIIGSTMASLKAFKEVNKKINDKKYNPFIDEVFKFKDIKKAHLRIENRKHLGKVILVP